MFTLTETLDNTDIGDVYTDIYNTYIGKSILTFNLKFAFKFLYHIIMITTRNPHYPESLPEFHAGVIPFLGARNIPTVSNTNGSDHIAFTYVLLGPIAFSNED